MTKRPRGGSGPSLKGAVSTPLASEARQAAVVCDVLPAGASTSTTPAVACRLVQKKKKKKKKSEGSPSQSEKPFHRAFLEAHFNSNLAKSHSTTNDIPCGRHLSTSSSPHLLFRRWNHVAAGSSSLVLPDLAPRARRRRLPHDDDNSNSTIDSFPSSHYGSASSNSPSPPFSRDNFTSPLPANSLVARLARTRAS
jgi:hypothetical protein